MLNSREKCCPVAPFERAGEDYAGLVLEWLSNPHAYFRAFGREAREFQRRHRSQRLRVMTLVAPAAELAAFRPLCISVDRSESRVDSWQQAFAITAARLAAANPATFVALQAAGEIAWMGCDPGGVPIAAAIEGGSLRPAFSSLEEVVWRIQWLFLVCGIRLNEVIAQVDPYTDDEWKVRAEDIRRRREADRAFMEGRRAAQKAWAEAHPEAQWES